MATPHKAPTQVSLAPTEEPSALHEWVNRHWLKVVGLVVIVTVAVLFSQFKTEEARGATLANWERLGEEVVLANPVGPLNPPSGNALASIAEDLDGGVAAPWAKAIEVGKRIDEEDLAGARAAIAELEEQWPDHPLVSGKLYKQPDGREVDLRRHLETSVSEMDAWEAAHSGLFSNPPLPEGAPRVRITTSAGPIVVGLYEEFAPKHAENFLKLCGEGFYDGTLFHRVIKDFMVQAGDPNSKDAEAKDTWGQGGPGYTLDPEVGDLWHFPGALASAATRAGGPTSGSQFYIVTGDDRHHLDGDYTVFGVLLEGQDVVTTIENGAVLGETPEEPVVIESTEVL